MAGGQSSVRNVLHPKHTLAVQERCTATQGQPGVYSEPILPIHTLPNP